MITRSQFGYALLSALYIPPSPDAVKAVVAWESMENTQALNNPLATERVMNQGETNFNPSGVKNYPTFEIGLRATVETLNNGLYQPLLDALKSGVFEDICNAIDNSEWGTKNVIEVEVDPERWNTPISSNDALPNLYQPPFPGITVVPPAPQPTVISYAVSPGSTLWSIAARYRPGTPAEIDNFVKTIYEANKEVLDASARAHGYSDSHGGALIFPGTIIHIPL